VRAYALGTYGILGNHHSLVGLRLTRSRVEKATGGSADWIEPGHTLTSIGARQEPIRVCRPGDRALEVTSAVVRLPSSAAGGKREYHWGTRQAAPE